MQEKRKYDNSSRARHQLQTREQILNGLQTLLATPGLAEVSMQQLAQAAGVSEATVFRHFPNKDALYAGLAERAAERFRLTPELADDLDSVRELSGPLFDYFAENRQLLAAARKIPDISAFGERTRRERARRIEELVSARFPRFGAEQRRVATALLHFVLSAQSWSWLVESFGLSRARASWAASWAYSTLLAGLDREHAAEFDPKPKGELSWK